MESDQQKGYGMLEIFELITISETTYSASLSSKDEKLAVCDVSESEAILGR
jgi:hypothetical protein